MDYSVKHKPVSLNMDKGYKNLTPNESPFMRGHDVLLSVSSKGGNNQGMGKPMPANYKACEKDQPVGENYAVGSYKSPLTNECYSWIYNHNGAHYIERISASKGCEVVYADDCLSLSAHPKSSIENFRAFMRIEKVCPNRDGKYLTWTNGDAPIGYLDVEASIKTNNFTTPFFNICPDPCAYSQLCVPDICGCIVAEWMPIDQSEIGLANRMIDIPIQLMVKHIYYDGRESIWSDRSQTYYQNAKGCFEGDSPFSRCLKVRVPIGNPMVEKIQIGYTVDQGQSWFIAETIEKYKKYNDLQEMWYERDLSEVITSNGFSEEDCAFDYFFCNDKGKIPIPASEISRVRNPVPRKAQGVIPIRESLGFYNYEDGNCPIDQKEAEKFQIKYECEDGSSLCQSDYATVTVRAIIHSRDAGLNQFVFRQKGVSDTDGDDTKDVAYYGGMRRGSPIPLATQSLGYGQKFSDKTRNFIAYVEGLPLWAEAKQWKSGPNFIGRSLVGIVSGMENEGQRTSVVNSIYDSRAFYYQEFKIRVLKGTRGFLRLAGQSSVSGVESSQNTSTSVKGIISISQYNGRQNPEGLSSYSEDEEIYFDACDGDVELDTAFFIDDLATYGDDGIAFSGYIKSPDGSPLEELKLYFDNTGDYLGTTDHNGFFHFMKNGDEAATVNIRGEKSCSGVTTIDTISVAGAQGTTTPVNINITDESYLNDYFAFVRQQVNDCSGTPLSGIRVSISGSKYKVTDSEGIAEFKIRNYSDRARSVRTVIMNQNGCLVQDCSSNCNPCMGTYVSPTPSCYFNNPIVTMPVIVVNVSQYSEVNRGLKSGGRYAFGFVVSGDCGRLSAVTGVQYVNIPKIQDLGYKPSCKTLFSAIGLNLPTWATCLKIVRGVNINNYQLQWKVDKIEKTSEGKVKLTIQSLNDYNSDYFFQTNTVYQYLKGDRVEFIRNGDGSILLTSVYGNMNYQILSPFNETSIGNQDSSEADFFNQIIIQDSSQLEGITEGAIIELQRPNENTSETIYYEICSSIPVINGKLLVEEGDFSTFDTFFVNRTIGSFFGQFEHHSPSDFWGNRVSDIGKAHVENSFETERRFGRNMTISSTTVPNYFGDLIKRFDAPGQGDIIGVGIKDGRIITAICENDNFMAEVSDDLVRVGSDGIIRALPPDQIVSDAQVKISGEYGCQYNGVGSIFFGDGYTTWIDTNRQAHVVHDGSQARDTSIGKVQSYFKKMCQKVASSSGEDLSLLRYAVGFNQSNQSIYRTIKSLRDNAINNSFKPYSQDNDTIIYHPLLDEWLGFALFVPERYVNIDLFDESGCSFISYFGGQAYVHPVISDKFNEFYEIEGDEIVTICFNEGPEKMKRLLSMEVQSEMLWLVKEVTTDNPSFVSEIPAVRFKRQNRVWDANFLYNKNSRSGLYGNGDSTAPQDTRGFFANITLVRDNTDELKYNTIDNTKRVKYNELDEILIKFVPVEQTGFNLNL